MSPPPEPTLPPKPEPPRPQDCCRGDCRLCVFERYERELERWRRAVEEIERKHRENHAEDRRS